METNNGDLRADSPLLRTSLNRDETVSVAVVSAVAALENVRVEDLPPLYDAVDPGALNELVRTLQTGAITFAYTGYLVRVSSDGVIQISDGDASAGQFA